MVCITAMASRRAFRDPVMVLQELRSERHRCSGWQEVHGLPLRIPKFSTPIASLVAWRGALRHWASEIQRLPAMQF
jgi:hypothetical protein